EAGPQRELEDLLNPLPKFTDPEDDHDEATKARVIDTFHQFEKGSNWRHFFFFIPLNLHLI
uniref:Uncharacterized protein n=1 Tax=Hippocampus comes TaxID=109280 RepID=A0A3Q2YR11_HIPCM